MKQKQVLGMIAFSLVLVLTLNSVSAFGFGPFHFGDDLTDEEIQEMQEHKEAVRQAIDSNDYDSWKSLMQERINKLLDGLTQENFEKVVERHNKRVEFREAMDAARETGDYSEVRSLKEEMGFKGKGFKMQKNPDKGSCLE